MSLRHGLCLPTLGDAARGDLIGFARRAEELGYDDVYVGDRLLTPVSPSDLYPAGGTPEHPYPGEFTTVLDPLVAISAAAAVTSRIRFGMSTLNASWYNAVVLGRALTSIDVLSGGRLDLGFGTSWMRDEYRAADVDWDSRGARLDETLDVLHAMWTENPFEYHGEFFEVPPSTMDLRPVQPGGPPLLLGGWSPPAVRRVGRRADGWLLIHGVPREMLARLWDLARSAAAEAGRDPEALRRELRVNVASDDTPDSLLAVCEQATQDGVDGVHLDFTYVAGTVEGQLERAEAFASAAGLV